MLRDSRDIIRRLPKASNSCPFVVRITSSDIRQAGRIVIVTHPRKDIPAGTVRSIYAQAGWPKD